MLSLKRIINKILNRKIGYDNIFTEEPLHTSNSQVVSTKTYYTGATMTIPANSLYLVCSVYSNGTSGNIYHQINVMSGTPLMFTQLGGGQSVSHSGSQQVNSAIVKTGNEPVIVRVYMYNYIGSCTLTTQLYGYRIN